MLIPLKFYNKMPVLIYSSVFIQAGCTLFGPGVVVCCAAKNHTGTAYHEANGFIYFTCTRCKIMANCVWFLPCSSVRHTTACSRSMWTQSYLEEEYREQAIIVHLWLCKIKFVMRVLYFVSSLMDDKMIFFFLYPYWWIVHQLTQCYHLLWSNMPLISLLA